MKRFTVLTSMVLGLLLSVSLSFGALAAGGVSYDIPELGMSLELPDDYIAITRSTKEGDKNAEMLYMTQEDLDDFFDDPGTYLYALNEDYNDPYSILVIAFDTDDLDYGEFTEEEFDELVSYLAEDPPDDALSYTVSKYKSGAGNFMRIKTLFADLENLAYRIARDGKYISISLFCDTDSGLVGIEQEELIEEIVDSVVFWDSGKPASASAEEMGEGEDVSSRPAEDTDKNASGSTALQTGRQVLTAVAIVAVILTIGAVALCVAGVHARKRRERAKAAQIETAEPFPPEQTQAAEKTEDDAGEMEDPLPPAEEEAAPAAAGGENAVWGEVSRLEETDGIRAADAAVEEAAEERGEEPSGEGPAVEPQVEAPAPQDAPKIRFCYKCGTKLVQGSAFCHKCGIKIEW